MSQASRSSRKAWIYGLTALIAVIVAATGYRTLNGATADVDPAKLATIETGTMVQSVVATGKVEPITKVEIKSKANGIIKVLPADLDEIGRAHV